LNPHAVETQYGFIVAMYSFGQCISAPTFGYWSNRIEQVRIPLLAGFVFMMIGNSTYLSLQFFAPSSVVAVMMVARFTTGSGTAFQLLFTPLGPDGIEILPFYRLSIYNAPALLALLFNMLGFFLVLCVFEEKYDVLNSEAAKDLIGDAQMTDSNGVMASPPSPNGMLYTKFGPKAPWSLEVVLVCIVIVMWIGFWRKMIPLQAKAQSDISSSREEPTSQ
ncbi:hypothetical protein TELCIR_12845, partial [Teladorsagia circumcincta]